jgi:fatty acid desaturase
MTDPAIKAEPWVPPQIAAADIDRKTLKKLMRRNDYIGILRLIVCLASFVFYGWLYYISWGTLWIVPTVILFGGTMSLFAYSLSHECAHGTAFKTRWLNEAIFWFSSILFGQEPVFRRYSHAEHHTYTWFWEKDAQMPFTVRQKVGWWEYFRWYSSLEYHFLFMKIAIRHALGLPSKRTRSFVPETELWPMQRNSMIFVAIWAVAIAVSIYFQTMALVWFYVVPKVVGDVINMTYVGTQHFEMGEDDIELLHTTRSIKPNWFVDLYYWNMGYHIEHHFAPTVPYHALPELNRQLSDVLPEPKGAVAITRDVFKAMKNRHLSVETDAMKMPTSH